MKKVLLIFCILVITLTLALPGCNMNRRPAPKPAPGQEAPGTPTPRETPGDMNQPSPMTPDDSPSKTTPPPAQKPAAPADSANKKLADAAKRVEGVKDATVVISGTTATVGIETEAKAEGEKTNEIKDQVVKEIKKADTSIKKVHVTTDPNIIARIEEVAMGVEKGRPISDFARELEEIARRITPSEGNEDRN